MSRPIAILLSAILIVGLGVFLWLYVKSQNETENLVESFEECAAKGYTVLSTNPRQCVTPQGDLFTEHTTNSTSTPNTTPTSTATSTTSSLIRVTNPKANQIIGSPLDVTGEARGTWYFEASFPVQLLDGTGKEIVIKPAQAQGDWMTTNFVPFKVQLEFKNVPTKTGTLVLLKDNPSGLPEHDAQVRIPVQFATSTRSTSSAQVVSGGCKVTGCSGQVCSDQNVVTTCEFKEEYACYRDARCERQTNGQCGWTQTAELISCIAAAR